MPVSLRPLLAHVVAAILAIAFAARIVASPYVATGLMFVAPGIVLLAAHAAFDFAMSRGRLSSRRVLARAATTAGACIAVVFAAMVILPLPGAAANVSNITDGIGVFLFCVIVAAIVIGVPLFGLYLLVLLVWAIAAAIRRTFFKRQPPPGGGTGVVREGGILLLAGIALAALSVEGLDGTFDFGREDDVAAQVFIAAPPAAVWAAIGKASAPGLPLPAWLQPFPATVSVSDGGDAPGSRRTVHFKGREGEGDLVLTAMPRAGDAQTWTVTLDSTPLANWAQGRSVTYRVAPDAGGARLEVTARYRRLLAPAWFFKPYMRAVIGSAMQVLAQDKHDRALAIAAR